MGPKIPELVLAVDPGKDQGWALFNAEDCRLLACGLGEYTGVAASAVVIECPQIYPSSTSRANPNDILRLAIRVGIQLERHRESTTYLVEPRKWTGQVPKEVRHARLAGKLSDIDWTKIASKIAPSKRHNVLDAVGIGLWFCSLSSLTRKQYRATFYV